MNSMLHNSAFNRRNGVILPVTMILLTFGTMMIVIAGLQVSRITSRLRDYEEMSNLQLAATNVVEVASGYLVKNFSNFTGTPWEGFGSFIDYVSERGGLEGVYWSSVMSEFEGGDFWNLKDKIDLSIIGENGKMNIGAVVTRKTDGYFVVGWAERDQVRRYAVGLVIPELNRSLPALRMGGIDRDFAQLKSTGKGNKEYFEGDLVYGRAIVTEVIGVVLTDNPENIFRSTVEAHDIIIGNDYLDYKTSGNFQVTTLDTATYFGQLKDEHLQKLSLLTHQMVETGTVNVSSDTILLEIFPGSDEVEMNFDDSGLVMKYGSNTIIVPTTENKVNVRIHGDVQVGRDQDSHKINRVNGNYSITVDGDIQIHSNIIYSDLVELITNKDNDVITQTLSNIAVLADTLSVTPSDSSLELVSIGGNVLMRYGQGGSEEGNSSHGVRVINGNYMAFEDNLHGGHFTFPDLYDALSGSSIAHIPQFLTVGSLTGLDIGSDNTFDLVDQFVIVSDESKTSNSDTQLSLVGIRVW